MMLKPSIRETTLQDLKQVYEIEIESFTKPYPLELFLVYYIISKDLFIVASYNNIVVGYAIGLIEYKNSEKLGHIISIAVRPLYRGLGIGEILMKELERRIRKYFVTYIYLEVEVGNKVAIALYRKLGYGIVSILPRYYGEKDAYLMVKKI
ncbi:MAG: ribosomal protein S18-alanine N-acetyltransferase [Desulfurococcales archaeon]|nr:ribosomal protein S18-alanine N-acetyltransferase [Desulfurococcales archaeon]